MSSLLTVCKAYNFTLLAMSLLTVSLSMMVYITCAHYRVYSHVCFCFRLFGFGLIEKLHNLCSVAYKYKIKPMRLAGTYSANDTSEDVSRSLFNGHLNL